MIRLIFPLIPYDGAKIVVENRMQHGIVHMSGAADPIIGFSLVNRGEFLYIFGGQPGSDDGVSRGTDYDTHRAPKIFLHLHAEIVTHSGS